MCNTQVAHHEHGVYLTLIFCSKIEEVRVCVFLLISRASSDRGVVRVLDLNGRDNIHQPGTNSSFLHRSLLHALAAKRNHTILHGVVSKVISRTIID